MSRRGKFIDVSKCTGCRACQVACKQWNRLPAQIEPFTGSYQTHKDTLTRTYTIVKMQEIEENNKVHWHFRKHQCLHCGEPTCVYICPHKSRKKMTGGIIYPGGDCEGCAYCAIKCPFGIPKIDSQAKRSYSCTMCYDRVANNMVPACSKACPTGAVKFGYRDDLIIEAEKRLAVIKATYPNANLYGLDFLGGTGVFYLLLKDPSFYDLPLNPVVPAPDSWFGTANGTPTCYSCHGDKSAAHVTHPAEGQTVGGIITVTAYADAKQAISKVEFYLDEKLIGTDTSAPYTCQVDTTKYSNGIHKIKAKPYTSSDSGESDDTWFYIDNTNTTTADTTAPVVSITSPLNGSTISGQVGLAADASDNVGVAKVELYVNGVLLGTDSTSPFGITWDTTKVSNGDYSIEAKAYDSAGNIGKSGSILVKVSNTSTTEDTTKPTVSITSPSNASKVKGTLTVKVDAKDNVGVTKVELYLNAALYATKTSSPFDFGVNTTVYRNGDLKIKAIAYDAAGNNAYHQIKVKVNN